MKTVSHVAIKKLSLDDHYNIINDQTELLSRQDIESSIAQLQPSDIFFTDSRYVSSFFIPGKRQHSIIYIGTRPKLAQAFGKNSDLYAMLAPYYTNDLEELIIDSSSEGVQVRSIMDVANLKENENSYLEGIIGFRITASPEKKQKFLVYALQNLGKEYDYDMLTEDSSAIYCSELIYQSLKRIWIKLKTRSYILWRIVVSPDDAVTSILQDGIPDKDFLPIFSITKKEGNVIDTSVKYTVK